MKSPERKKTSKKLKLQLKDIEGTAIEMIMKFSAKNTLILKRELHGSLWFMTPVVEPWKTTTEPLTTTAVGFGNIH